MRITRILQQAKDLGLQGAGKALELFGSGYEFARRSIGNLPFFASCESSSSYDEKKYDEKHYFLMPYRLAEHGYTLYSMRCLPEGVPPINDLPKRRVFHLPSEHATPLVEKLLQDGVDQKYKEASPPGTRIGNSLVDLADKIDRLDNRLFGGILLIGALVAFVNPVAGAAVAAKALVPSVGLLLSKAGLKSAGEKLNAARLQKEIQSAREQVLKEFRGANTESFPNPVLEELDRALHTTEFQHDPLFEFEFGEVSFGKRDTERLLELTCRAIANVYGDIVANRKQWKKACLGPEDIRWLELIAVRANRNRDDE